MTERSSREDLLAFLDYCKDKGLLKAATAEARKAAVNQMLGILKDDESRDVTNLDLDSVLKRFQNLHGARYTPGSLKTYRNRVRNSISDFVDYQQNPMDFRPRVTPTLRRPKSSSPSAEAKSAANKAQAPAVQPASSGTFMSTATLPIPLRADLTVLVHGLPFDLSENEAKKIANVIMAMALPSSGS